MVVQMEDHETLYIVATQWVGDGLRRNLKTSTTRLGISLAIEDDGEGKTR